jgi:hypothetical protein
MSAAADELVPMAVAGVPGLKAKGSSLRSDEKLGLITNPEQMQAFFGQPAKKARVSEASTSTASGGPASPSLDSASNFTGSQLPSCMSDAGSVFGGSEAEQLAGSNHPDAVPASDEIPSTQPRPANGAEGLDDAELMHGIQTDTSAKLFEKAIGVPLTEENIKHVQQALQEKGKAVVDASGADEGRGIEDLPPADRKRAEALNAAINAGCFDTRSYLGNKFRNEHKVGTEAGDQYKAIGNREAAAAFRMEWCQKQLKNMLESKSFTRSWRRVDRCKGVYRNFGRLVQDLGGWQCPEAVAGATTAVSKCLLLGAPWVHRHPQTELVEYLVLQTEFEEEFDQNWKHFVEHWNGTSGEAARKSVCSGGEASGQAAAPRADALGDKPVAPPGGTRDGDSTAAAARGGTGTARAGAGQAALDGGKVDPGISGGKPRKGGRGKKTGDGNPPEDPDSPNDGKKIDPIAALLKKSAKMKNQFHSASSNFIQINQAIETDNAWAWARGGIWQTKLHEAKTALQESMTPWHKEFLCSDAAVMKKKYTPERLTVELSNFVEAGPLIEKLAKVVAGISKAHDDLAKLNIA